MERKRIFKIKKERLSTTKLLLLFLKIAWMTSVIVICSFPFFNPAGFTSSGYWFLLGGYWLAGLAVSSLTSPLLDLTEEYYDELEVIE